MTKHVVLKTMAEQCRLYQFPELYPLRATGVVQIVKRLSNPLQVVRLANNALVCKANGQLEAHMQYNKDLDWLLLGEPVRPVDGYMVRRRAEDTSFAHLPQNLADYIYVDSALREALNDGGWVPFMWVKPITTVYQLQQEFIIYDHSASAYAATTDQSIMFPERHFTREDIELEIHTSFPKGTIFAVLQEADVFREEEVTAHTPNAFFERIARPA